MIRIITGDLAALEVGALIRPVSSAGSAVTPAMRRLELAAGRELEEQCRRLGDLPLGSASITGAGILPAEFMIHVSVWSAEEPVSPAVVRRGLLNALRRVGELDIHDFALVPLGTGAGNLDAETAAEIMIPALIDALADRRENAQVTIVVESDYERHAFERVLGAQQQLP